jgi:hypothetical protein
VPWHNTIAIGDAAEGSIAEADRIVVKEDIESEGGGEGDESCCETCEE